MIDHDFYLYRTCKIIISAPHRVNANSLARQLRQKICSENLTTKEEEEKGRQHCAGSIPESTNEKASKSSASKCRQFGKDHKRDFVGRGGRSGVQINVSEGG